MIRNSRAFYAISNQANFFPIEGGRVLKAGKNVTSNNSVNIGSMETITAAKRNAHYLNFFKSYYRFQPYSTYLKTHKEPVFKMDRSVLASKTPYRTNIYFQPDLTRAFAIKSHGFGYRIIKSYYPFLL